MDNKKWPVLAQVLIALGLIGPGIGLVGTILTKSIPGVILSLAGLIVYWNFYQFKKWAKTGVNIFLVLNIISNLIMAFQGTKSSMYVVGVAFSVLVLVYFNSSSIKALFEV